MFGNIELEIKSLMMLFWKCLPLAISNRIFVIFITIIKPSRIKNKNFH